MEQALNRKPDNRTGRGQDQRAFDCGRKELDLLMAVVVATVDRARGVPECEERGGSGNEIDDRLDRVREKSNRVGDEVRSEFERDRNERRSNREPAPF